MTTLTHGAAYVWAAGHRILLAAVVVVVAAAVTLTVVLTGTGRPAPDVATTPSGPLPVVDDGCAAAGPATPC
ncbi:hypothetical protein [Petropleomorpha daqingensis]|uniref:Uncharacterized protein n=1 Tax=Petropleomorpha daqingensis TaxID=2026353 RepID=A0A853CAH7_9ACTN|nr:hypothetical protein [Petropleomorpha daqingensis]NYJ04026.1 hypothetical protein [Petropleomorpha daqingensis]